MPRWVPGSFPALPALIAVVVLFGAAPAAQAQVVEPTLDQVVARMSKYAAGYGEQASLIVGVEKYEQNTSLDTKPLRPRRLTAEFAIVRALGVVGWVGFRDVVEVDGRRIADRADRLRQLFTGSSFDASAVMKISNESARYNVGPAIRNFNVPTTALFFFHPATVGRFTFTRKGTKRIGPIDAWEIGFTEIRRPTLIMKRDGTDVPCEGTVWVVPADGTVIRTRLQLRHFADQQVRTGKPAPPPPAAPQPRPPDPGARGTSVEWVDLASLADIDVTYERDTRLGLWLPVKMTEVYEGAMTLSAGGDPRAARAATEAKYSDFRKFQTSAKITFPK